MFAATWVRAGATGRGCCDLVAVSARGAMGTSHSPVRRHLCPLMMARPRYLTVQPILVNMTSHPALHNVTTDRRECDASPGIRCAFRAACGRAGIAMVQSCVVVTLDPSGMVTLMGDSVSRTFSTGAVMSKKLLVAPESNIAQLLRFCWDRSTVFKAELACDVMVTAGTVTSALFLGGKGVGYNG